MRFALDAAIAPEKPSCLLTTVRGPLVQGLDLLQQKSRALGPFSQAASNAAKAPRQAPRHRGTGQNGRDHPKTSMEM